MASSGLVLKTYVSTLKKAENPVFWLGQSIGLAGESIGLEWRIDSCSVKLKKCSFLRELIGHSSLIWGIDCTC
jgi:hypothetical protein